MPAIFCYSVKIMMNKKDFRIKQKQTLQNFPKEEKAREEHSILEQLKTLPELKNAQTIGVTASLPFEVDTAKIIAHLWDEGKKVYLAKVMPHHQMNFIRYTYQSKLKKSKFGVEEIADLDAEVNNDLDLLIVPGLAFASEQHERLGFGGGYYDRFLANHSNTKTIALANSKMIFAHAEWPIDETDLPVQIIVTAKKVYR